MGLIKIIFILFAYAVLALAISLIAGGASKFFDPSAGICFSAFTFLAPALLIWLMRKYIFDNMA